MIYYNIEFGYDGINLKIFFDKDDEKLNDLYKKLFPNKKTRARSNKVFGANEDWNEYVYDIGLDSLETKIAEDLDLLFSKLNEYEQLIKKYI